MSFPATTLTLRSRYIIDDIRLHYRDLQHYSLFLHVFVRKRDRQKVDHYSILSGRVTKQIRTILLKSAGSGAGSGRSTVPEV